MDPSRPRSGPGRRSALVRRLAIAAAISGLLGAAALLLLSGPRGTPRPAEPAASTPAADRAIATAAAAAPPARPDEPRAIAPATSEVPWDQVEVMGHRPVPGSPLNDIVRAALAEMRDAVDPCFEADLRLRRAAAAPAREASQGPGILELRMEAREGRLVVVGIEVDSLGYSSPELVTCCERVLRAYEVRAPDLPAGRRVRITMMLL